MLWNRYLCDFFFSELIEEKRRSVKEEVDVLISQWQNVNFEEITNEGAELFPPNLSLDHFDLQNPADSNDSLRNENAMNGVRASNDGEKSRNSENHETDLLYSAKEQRLKKTSKIGNFHRS